MKTIITPRLKLIIITPEVHKHSFETLKDEELKNFMGYADDFTLNLEKENFKKGVATYNRLFVNFIMRNRETDEVVGWCGFHTWYPKHNRAEIGYSISYDTHKQKGYMSEALHAILEYGFDTMNLHRVEAMAADYNTASVKLLKKFGFTFEGCLRQHYNVAGKMEDSQMYSLLRHEFKGVE